MDDARGKSTMSLSSGPSQSSGRGRQGKAAAAKHQKEKRRKRQAKAREAQLTADAHDQRNATLPRISEHDLWRFQHQHFGDDSVPEHWFVGPDVAINYARDDGLGYYPDGVKRTLTDDQIALFRRTELWQMKRAHQQRQHDAAREAPASPVSDVSSLEDALLVHASVNRAESAPQPSQPRRGPSTSHTTGSWKGRPRQPAIPYHQRKKRKWEGYIDRHDPVQGSLTSRRRARELDQQQAESIDMDY